MTLKEAEEKAAALERQFAEELAQKEEEMKLAEERRRQEQMNAEALKCFEDERDRLLADIEKLQRQESEARESKERASSTAQKTKSGVVYIVSNIGSFGEDVLKVGLTRRLDPMNRIKELSGASVPFPFDVHAMISSEDAPALEAKIHSLLEDHRVNRINRRKGVFPNRHLDDSKDSPR